MKLRIINCVVATILTGSLAVPADEPETSATEPAKQTAETSIETPQSNRWLLLTCGLTGDDEHRERMTEACRRILSFAEMTLNVPADRIRFLAADEQMESELSDVFEASSICTSESVEAAISEFGEAIPETDSCWVIMIGHAHLHGKNSQYNVLDADFDQFQFGEWAQNLKCKEQVFWLTFPVSGYWIRPLRSESRVVISATEADLELPGTEMPYALADVLSGESENAQLEDIDNDGQLSLLDLYLAASLEVDGDFKAIERLQTEHGLLDDNSDGRGSEIQSGYIPPEVVEVEEESDADDNEEEEAEDDPADNKVTGDRDPDADESDAQESAPDDNLPDDASEESDADETESNDDDAVDSQPNFKLPPPISNRNLDGYRSRFIPVSPIRL